MRYIKINGNMSDELLKPFIEEVNGQTEDLTIYFTSNGGLVSCADVMIDIINANPDRFTLFAVENIASAAFRLFFSVSCKRHITHDTIGMFHHARRALDMQDTGTPYYDSEQFWFDRWEYRKKITTEWCITIGMNQDEIDRINKGDEVHFYTNRLEEFLKITSNPLLQRPGLMTGAPLAEDAPKAFSINIGEVPETINFSAEGKEEMEITNISKLPLDKGMEFEFSLNESPKTDNL